MIDSFRNDGHAAGVGHVLPGEASIPLFQEAPVPLRVVVGVYRDRTANVWDARPRGLP